VGTLERFNNGKAAEERDRVKHSLNLSAKPLKSAGAGDSLIAAPSKVSDAGAGAAGN
jgi:hypothetical protein